MATRSSTRLSYLVRLLLAATFCLLGAAAAHAEDFTFQVPVQLKNVQANVTAFHVACSVYDKNKQFLSGTIGNPISLDATGSATQTVTLKFNAGGKDPSLATTYECDVFFDGIPGTQGGCAPGNDPLCPVKSGSWRISGNIPQQ